MSSFSYEIEYRAGQRHQNADALSRRPCNDGCKWCKEWKRVAQMVSVAVQTDASSVVCGEFVVEQREALPDKQSETEFSVFTEHCSSDPALVDSRCNTIKLEPTWTREYLYSQQVADPSLKVIIQFKEASAARPSWKEVSSYDHTVKALWAQWTPAGIPRSRTVSEMGRGKWYQNNVPDYTSKKLAGDCTRGSP